MPSLPAAKKLSTKKEVSARQCGSFLVSFLPTTTRTTLCASFVKNTSRRNTVTQAIYFIILIDFTHWNMQHVVHLLHINKQPTGRPQWKGIHQQCLLRNPHKLQAIQKYNPCDNVLHCQRNAAIERAREVWLQKTS